MVRKAADLMDPAVLVVDPSTDVLSCAKRMAERGQGYAILAKPEGPAHGIETEWDIVKKVVAAGLDPAAVTVSSIGSSSVVTCAPDLSTDRVVEVMVRRGVRRLVVTQGDRVVGVITTRRVLEAFRKYVDAISSDIAKHDSTGSVTGT